MSVPWLKTVEKGVCRHMQHPDGLDPAVDPALRCVETSVAQADYHNRLELLFLAML
jgi:hypothetical protein